jgi:hypothetical protein
MKRFNVFIVLATLMIFPCLTRADFMRQTIKNTTGGDVNDAVIQFNGHITKVKMGGATGVINSGVTQDSAEFAQDTFGTLGDDGTINVDYSTNGKSTILGGSSQWTYNGTNKGTIKTVGKPMQVDGPLAIIDFFNPDPVPIVYSGIAVWVNNDLTGYNIDQFFTPTGTLITGLPTTITLNPGQSAELSFGPTSDIGYDLVLATVADVSDPTNLFNVVDATLPTPEPSSLLLLITGSLCVASACRNRFKRIAVGEPDEK